MSNIYPSFPEVSLADADTQHAAPPKEEDMTAANNKPNTVSNPVEKPMTGTTPNPVKGKDMSTPNNKRNAIPTQMKKNMTSNIPIDTLPDIRDIANADYERSCAEKFIKENERYILVEGPAWGDAEFYGKWLLMVAKATALFEDAINDLSFKEQIDRLMVGCHPDFGITATVMLSRLAKGFSSFALQLYSDELVDDFVTMAEMGFFVLTGERYQMAMPAQLTMEAVKSAALKYAQTEDAECYLHPERLVAAMPKTKAEEWQKRLQDARH
jgi:hypothetical protein